MNFDKLFSHFQVVRHEFPKIMYHILQIRLSD